MITNHIFTEAAKTHTHRLISLKGDGDGGPRVGASAEETV